MQKEYSNKIEKNSKFTKYKTLYKTKQEYRLLYFAFLQKSG